jgi:hypothetical protein
MKEKIKNQNITNKRKYWYRDTIYSCVLCTKDTHYRERVYNKNEKETTVIETACCSHF